MSNALWTGVRLNDVLDRAGVKPGAVLVRFGGLDEPVIQGAPKFLKSLEIDHAPTGTDFSDLHITSHFGVTLVDFGQSHILLTGVSNVTADDFLFHA